MPAAWENGSLSRPEGVERDIWCDSSMTAHLLLRPYAWWREAKEMEEKKELKQEEMKKINGNFSPYGGTICDRCGGIKDNPSVPDE